MIEDSNTFSQKIKYKQQTQQQIASIDSIIQNSKAIHFYYRLMLKKYFQYLKPNRQMRHLYLLCYFNRFIEGIYLAKSQKIVKLIQKRFYTRIKLKTYLIKFKRQRLLQLKQKMLSFKNKIIFQQWQTVTKIQKIQKIISNKKKNQDFKEFIELLRENQRISSITKLQLQSKNNNTSKFYRIKLQNRTFQSLKMNTKIQKLTKTLRFNYFQEFVRKSMKCNSADRALVCRFTRRLLLKRSFFGWKQLYQQQIAGKFYQARILQKYFSQWKQNLVYIASEKQIDCNNERIIDISLERIQKKTLLRVFKAWKLQVEQMKENRHRNSIINTYAEKQNKYTLLSKYFQKLRLNCLNNQVKLKYRNTKLKRKAFDAFKIDLQQSAVNEEKVILFIQKKYFRKIKSFNAAQTKIINKHRLQRFFFLFTGSIISQYCQKNDSARIFYQTNLLFKSIFAIKQQRSKRLLQEYAIGFVNVIMPMRRWHRYHRITKYLRQKKWFFKKTIFREWRMQVVRKYSQKKLIKEFNAQESADKSNHSNESKLQLFQFQNIMATIAKIRNNLDAEKKQTRKKRDQPTKNNQQISLHTPSQSINFSYSLQTI